MTWGPDHPRWLLFAGEVLVTGKEIEEEDRRSMSVQVQGLAEIVKQAKQAIDKAATMSTRVNASATNLVATVAAVEAMVGELDQANAQLQGALGTITNGAPPLDQTGENTSTTTSPPSAPSQSNAAAPATDPSAVASSPATVAPVAADPNPADVNAAKMQVEIANAGAPAPQPPQVAPQPVAMGGPAPSSVQATADKYIPRTN